MWDFPNEKWKYQDETPILVSTPLETPPLKISSKSQHFGKITKKNSRVPPRNPKSHLLQGWIPKALSDPQPPWIPHFEEEELLFEMRPRATRYPNRLAFGRLSKLQLFRQFPISGFQKGKLAKGEKRPTLTACNSRTLKDTSLRFVSF